MSLIENTPARVSPLEKFGTGPTPGGNRPAPSAASGMKKLLAFEDSFFLEWRLRVYGAGVFAAYAFAVLLSWSLHHNYWVVDANGHLSDIDFCWIWVSGKFAVSDAPILIYDHAVFAAAQDNFFPPGECLFLHQYVYPPTFLFFTFPLGLIPYLPAFAGWVVVTLIVYLTAVYTIIPGPTAVIAALTSAAALKNFQLGHTGFFIAALFGLSLVFMERRPWVSGVFLGLLICKPQYGVLFPVALLGSRNWRAIGSASVTAIVLGVVAAFAFGFQGWPSFIGSLLDRNAGLSPDGQVELSIQSVYGLLHWAGASVRMSWTAHLIVAVIVALTVWRIWVAPIPFSLKAAVLCIGSIMFTPYVLAYDLCVLTVAVAFLVRDGLSRGFLPGERIVVLLCWAGLFWPATPLAPIICATLLSLVIRRFVASCRFERAQDLHEQSSELR